MQGISLKPVRFSGKRMLSKLFPQQLAQLTSAQAPVSSSQVVSPVLPICDPLHTETRQKNIHYVCTTGAIAQWLERPPATQKVLSSNPDSGIVPCGYGCTTHVVVLRLSQGTLNRGAFCVRMHLRTCPDLKYPG